jgi:hypothetical protein
VLVSEVSKSKMQYKWNNVLTEEACRA